VLDKCDTAAESIGMKAALFEAVAQPLVLRDIPSPELEQGEVLIETRCCGICGTDLHILEGHGYVPRLPHILGHEPSGVVAAVGAGVQELSVGDRVVPSLFFTCNECYYCRVGRHQQCAKLKGILGVLSPGAFAEYFKAPAMNLFRLPDSVPFDVGGLIADAVVTALHATKRGALFPGWTGVVIGAGGVGQCLIQLLVASGIRLAAVEPDANKQNIARELGAQEAFKPGVASAEIQKWAVSDGVQCVFDCVGSKESLNLATNTVMNGGRVVIIGEQQDALPVTSTEIAQRELEIVGSRNGTRQDMAEAIRLVADGKVRPIIAARYPFEQINEAIQHVRRGAAGRVVVDVKAG
jgi:D-arabinose 1-dehydrogenase-like Zn-dependent alcohol dehydrogenase